MTRLPGIDPSQADPPMRAVFEGQTDQWGAPLGPFLLYGRRPTILRAVRGMWSGLETSGLVDGRLRPLVNRRVAAVNGCEF
ncbi:MAG: hypothetical protein ACRDY7_06375 [Acidimicrobiia bacterium]